MSTPPTIVTASGMLIEPKSSASSCSPRGVEIELSTVPKTLLPETLRPQATFSNALAAAGPLLLLCRCMDATDGRAAQTVSKALNKGVRHEKFQQFTRAIGANRDDWLHLRQLGTTRNNVWCIAVTAEAGLVLNDYRVALSQVPSTKDPTTLRLDILKAGLLQMLEGLLPTLNSDPEIWRLLRNLHKDVGANQTETLSTAYVELIRIFNRRVNALYRRAAPLVQRRNQSVHLHTHCTPNALIHLVNAVEVEDQDLCQTWSSGLRRSLIAASRDLNQTIPGNNVSAQDIREWLASDEGRALAAEVRELKFVVTVLPPEIALFTRATSLKINGAITKIPGFLHSLTQLEFLDLSESQITRLPGFFARCPRIILPRSPIPLEIDPALVYARTWIGTPFLLVRPNLFNIFYCGPALAALFYGGSYLYSRCKEPAVARVGRFSLGGMNGISEVGLHRLQRLPPSLAFFQKWSARTFRSYCIPDSQAVCYTLLAIFVTLILDPLLFVLWNFWIALIASIWGFFERRAYFNSLNQVHPIPASAV